MKRKSLGVVSKILTSLFLFVYSFTPSVMAIDDLYTTDTSQDILEDGISDPEWITNGNSAVTSDVVVLNKTYIAPQDSDVTVTFTKLPSEPSTLSIKQITLTQEEVNATGAVSNIAYDINTSMVDGTFLYDLTLPSSSNDAKVVYAESRKDLLNNVQEISNPVIDNGSSVEIQGLNHFTIYIVTSPTGPTLTTATVNNVTAVTVRPGTSISVNLTVGTNGNSTSDDWKSTRYMIGDGSWVCVDTPDHNGDGTYSESFSISAPTTDGVYDLSLRAYNLANCSGDSSQRSSIYTLNNAITVDSTITPPVLTNDPLDPYALTSVTGIWNQITGGQNLSGLNTNTIRWGYATGSQNSGLTFTNSGLQSFAEGEVFYLGMLTHMNWPVTGGTPTGARLQITLDFDRPDITNPVLTYDFDIEETSNGGSCPWYQQSSTPCDDRITFPNSFGTQTFTIDDVQYTLVIDGFVNSFPSGNAVSAFVTEEQKDNSAFLVGHLSSVLVERPQILLTKKTNGLDISSVANAQSLYIGDPVTWQYVVQNSGNTTLTNITVIDNPSETISCPKTTLVAGEVMTCTASGTVQSGLFSNTATARGNHTTGSVQTSDSSFYIGSMYCGDNIKNGAEQCDGTDGVPNSEFSCTNRCELELIQPKVTVCHASNSQSNPYITNNPDKSADVSGHDGHNGPIWYAGITTSWGDIIPPFYYIGGYYAGKNWTTEGQAIWNNDCNIPQGKLIVQKTTLPAGDTTVFSITASGTGTILNGASGTITDTTDYEYTVTPGTYSVNEDLLSGWGQTSNTCTNISVAKGETKYCTIENKKLPVLTVEKVLNGISVPLNTFSFVVDGWNTVPFEADGSNNILLTPGTAYSITETDPGAKYDVTYSTNCNGTLSYNQTATCTITNTEYGTLTIVKDANPDTNTSFDFTTSGTGISDFSLIGDDSTTFTNLLPGTYSVTEDSLSGWDLTNVTCSDRSSNTAISLSAGENITCTFTNTMRGAIGGYKYNDLDGEASTTTDRTGVAGWTIYMDTNSNGSLDAGEISTVTDLNGSYSFTNLIPGVYQLREVLVTGWYKIYPSTDYIDVTLDPGEQDYNNNFVNVEEGTITVYKNVDTDGDGDIDITNSSDWKWDINGIGDYATGTTVSNVKPGTYTISEENTTGYHVSNLVCNDETIGVTSTTDITMESGDDVVCTFTNTRDTGTLEVVKNLINDNGGTLGNQDFDFTVYDSSNNVVAASSFEVDGINEISLPTGGYYVRETENNAYTTSYNDCGHIQITTDGEATCTITNNDKSGTLIVQKILINDNGGNESVTDFDFTVNGTDTHTFEADGENSITVNAGTYNVTEVENGGYDTSYDGCADITIPNGESRTCIITNDDIAPSITLIKEVQNDYAGTAGVNDFGLTIGSTVVESGTPLTVNANESISLNENGLDGYEFVSMTGEGCPTELGGTVTLNEGEELSCTITNRALPATINIYKDVLNSSFEGEGVYTDTTFNVYLNGDVESAQQISDTEIDPLVAEYTNLDTGFYTITEDPTDGYSFVGCYNPNDFIDTFGFRVLLPNTFYVANGQTLDIICENMIIDPELELTKSNNTGGADMLAGENVVYTLTVTAPTREEDYNTLRTTLFDLELEDEEEYNDKYVVKDVKVVDLPPEGFTYQSGSWTATSSVRGDLKLQNITPEPQYHSPATWFLGDMIEGEVVTLTYTANISNTQDAGDYEDLALARGYFLDGGKVFANQNAGIFVDTNVNVVEDIQEGQVLGVTDYEYPDTGAKTVITISAIVSAILGALLLLIKPKKKSTILAMSAILVLGGIALLNPTKAYADDGDIAVRIEQPESPYNKTNFKIGFVSLDISGRELQIQCLETTHGVFQTTTVKAGGNSGDCIVDSSVITSTGTYEFYVIASADSDSSVSEKVKVDIDLNGPSPVVGYEKTKPEDCKYTLSFTTANDGGQTQQVQIFRSTNRTFTANSSTLIAELTATSAQAMTYTDTLPVCSAEYFYAIRALDDANNTSTFVTDAQVIVIPPTTPTTPVVVNPEGTEAVQGETTTDNEETPQDGNDTNGEVQGETISDDEAVAQSKFWNWFKYVLIGIGVASLGGVAYIYVSNRRNNKKAY